MPSAGPPPPLEASEHPKQSWLQARFLLLQCLPKLRCTATHSFIRESRRPAVQHPLQTRTAIAAGGILLERCDFFGGLFGFSLGDRL